MPLQRDRRDGLERVGDGALVRAPIQDRRPRTRRATARGIMPVVQQGDIEPAERAKLGTFTRELRDCAFQGNAVSGSPPNHEPRTGSIISRRWRSLIIASAVVIPVLLYRRSWSWWLMAYFYFLPHKLPNNQDAPRDDEER